MTVGLELRDASNEVTFTSTSVTWNQVASFSVAANGSASNTYSVLSGRQALAVQMFVNPPPLTRKALAHNITISNGTNVSVSGGSEEVLILVLMR